MFNFIGRMLRDRQARKMARYQKAVGDAWAALEQGGSYEEYLDTLDSWPNVPRVVTEREHEEVPVLQVLT